MGGWIKYLTVKGLSVLGFLGSWYVSFELATTLASNKYDYYLSGVIVTVMQASSFYFFVKARKTTKRKTTYVILSVLLFGISILGTLVYQFNMHSKAQNENYFESDAYKSKKERRELAKKFISNLEADKKAITSTTERQIKNLESKINKLDPREYVTKVQQLNDSINSLIEKRDKNIQKINENIKGQNKELSLTDVSSSTEITIQGTKGYLSFTKKVGKWLDVEPSVLALLIQFFIAVVFEFTAIGTHLAADEERGNLSKKQNNRQESIVNTAKQRKQNNDVTENDIKKFFDEMNSNKDSKGYLKKSYKKIAKENLGFKESKARKIYEQLKEEGKIKVVNGNTKIA